MPSKTRNASKGVSNRLSNMQRTIKQGNQFVRAFDSRKQTRSTASNMKTTNKTESSSKKVYSSGKISSFNSYGAYDDFSEKRNCRFSNMQKTVQEGNQFVRAFDHRKQNRGITQKTEETKKTSKPIQQKIQNKYQTYSQLIQYQRREKNPSYKKTQTQKKKFQLTNFADYDINLTTSIRSHNNYDKLSYQSSKNDNTFEIFQHSPYHFHSTTYYLDRYRDRYLDKQYQMIGKQFDAKKQNKAIHTFSKQKTPQLKQSLISSSTPKSIKTPKLQLNNKKKDEGIIYGSIEVPLKSQMQKNHQEKPKISSLDNKQRKYKNNQQKKNKIKKNKNKNHNFTQIIKTWIVFVIFIGILVAILKSLP